MKSKWLTYIGTALLLALLPYQFHLIQFAVPRFAWIQEGFLISAGVALTLVAVIALPFKAAYKALAACLGIVLFSALLFFSAIGLQHFASLAVVGSILAVIGIFLPSKAGKVSGVLLGLCVFSWLFLGLVYMPIAVFYVEYFHRLRGDLSGSLVSAGSALKEGSLIAVLVLPSALLYLITRRQAN